MIPFSFPGLRRLGCFSFLAGTATAIALMNTPRRKTLRAERWCWPGPWQSCRPKQKSQGLRPAKPHESPYSARNAHSRAKSFVFRSAVDRDLASFDRELGGRFGLFEAEEVFASDVEGGYRVLCPSFQKCSSFIS